MTLNETLLQNALKAIPAKEKSNHNKMLIRKLAEHIASDESEHFTPELLLDIMKNHEKLAKKRVADEPTLKIYSPKSCPKGRQKTIIDVVSDDYAFLIDSIIAEINDNNFLIDLMIHPIIYCKYSENNVLEDITGEKTDGYIQRSHIHIQLNGIPSKDKLKKLEDGICQALKDVAICNKDWRPMLAQLKKAKEDLASAKTRRPLKEVQQYCDFLDYLYDNNFTLLGYREYEFVERNGELKSQTVRSSGLGMLHNAVRPAYISETDEGLPRNLQEKRRSLPPLSISKTNRLATVHRRVPMDAVAIKTYDKDGNVTGEKLFLGLFTSVTYSRSVSSVPYLREKVEEVLDMSGAIARSHNRKALRHILERYPRDELFQISTTDLLKISTDILRLQERQRIALFTRKDPFRRYISCLVYIPRDRFSSDLRQEMCEILETELKGECYNFYTSMDDSVFARVMFIINVRQSDEMRYDANALEKKLQEAGKTWPETLSEALSTTPDYSSNIGKWANRYGNAFPISYTNRYPAEQGIFDIRKIEEALNTGVLQLDLYKPKDTQKHQMRLKVYNPDTPLNLSDVMPILQNLGLRAISELPFEVQPEGTGKSIWLHDFLLESPTNNTAINVEDVKKNFEAGFSKIWCKYMDNDGLNRLIPNANMTWRQVTILRAYVRYMKQIRYPLSRHYIETALNAHPEISLLIIELFKAWHYPKLKEDREAAAEKIKNKIQDALVKVESLDYDRILRMFTSLVEATLRTNYFQRTNNGDRKPYLSMKFDCSLIPDMPEPRPYREIFVYSPHVEGVHLRGDKIARGGLRWSDRHDDFRTEVLGLMKAQMVKNAVIVPMGAKGGFVVKTPTHSREEFMEKGIECYKTFIRGLLDITDNRKGSKIIPPQDVVRRDGDDPYLVVAADKGTASFSDIANSLSQEYGFWLDDAFASGGSAGYDHKKMGITAKGAWESVKLLFRELNHNTQENDFDVVGVGDMGGDVFGNGMLLSKHIRLIGAFNHLHIFCDPTPDAASSWKERKRLFDNVKGWGDYDTKKLSKGGRIYSRSDKTLKLTPEIKARFDLDKDSVTPNELMQAILKARTDLLWFGGIGTYIKSTSETHTDAGDKANDTIRIDATELRAKVVGEGANLGVTQLGRIEYAKKGGKINTDFVDNSGGVNSSDLEVNIKILLSDVMSGKASKMDIKSRNKLLEKMTEDVNDLVLRNNYQQAQAISLAEIQAREDLQLQNDFIKDLERDKGLSRKLEGLPDEKTIDERIRLGKGLTRPELSVLVSYAKIGFTQELLDSDIPDNKDMTDWLVGYFPGDLQKKYIKEIKRHRLAREIIATQMANSLINRMGPTFLKSKMDKTGANPAQIARAYIVVRDAYNLRGLWDEVEALDNKVPAEVQIKAMREISGLARHSIAWFLTRFSSNLDIGRAIDAFGPSIQNIIKNTDKILPSSLKETIKLNTEAGQRDGLPKKLAEHIAILPILASACPITRIAHAQKTDLLETARIYFEVGEQFSMDWLRQQAKHLPSENHWQNDATQGLITQMFSCQAALTSRILKDSKKNDNKGDIMETWMDSNRSQIDKLAPLFTSLRRTGTIDLSMLVIAEQRLRNLAGG